MANLLFILLLVQLQVIHSFSLTITRGLQDKFHSNIQLTSTDNIDCDSNGYCHCAGNYNTFIFDSESSSGECVKDEEIIAERSEGKYLPKDHKCLGVSEDENISNLSCRNNDLSVRWLWSDTGHMLNLRTLKCLEAKTVTIVNKKGRRKKKKSLTLKQCDTSNSYQSWNCKKWKGRDTKVRVSNKGLPVFRKNWIKESGSSLYFTNCESRSSYQGPYLFSNAKFMRLIKKSETCKPSATALCSLKLDISAPINVQHTSCQMDWGNSHSSFDGRNWNHFRNNSENFVLISKSPDELTLKILNKDKLLTKWSGNLLKLGIVCSNGPSQEHHYVLLKVEGSATENIPFTQSDFMPPFDIPPTSRTTSRPTLRRTSKSGSPVTSHYSTNTKTPSRLPTKNLPTTIRKLTTYLKQTSTLSPDINKESLDGNKDTPNLVAIVVPTVVLFCSLPAVIAIALCHRRRQRLMNIIKENETRVYEETIPRSYSPRQSSTQPEQSFDFLDDGLYQVLGEIQRDEVPTPDNVNNHDDSDQTVPGSPVYHTLERSNEADNNEESVYTELDEASRSPEPVYNTLVS